MWHTVSFQLPLTCTQKQEQHTPPVLQARPKQDQMWTRNMVSVLACASVARGITLPCIGLDKLISDRAVWKLSLSAFLTSRLFFRSFFSFSTWEWRLWNVVTQFSWIGLSDPLSLHVDVEVWTILGEWNHMKITYRAQSEGSIVASLPVKALLAVVLYSFHSIVPCMFIYL